MIITDQRNLLCIVLPIGYMTEVEVEKLVFNFFSLQNPESFSSFSVFFL